MSRHRIFGSEADKPKPLAYIRVYPPGRRGVSGYVAAAVRGSLATLMAGVAMAVLNGVLIGHGP